MKVHFLAFITSLFCLYPGAVAFGEAGETVPAPVPAAAAPTAPTAPSLAPAPAAPSMKHPCKALEAACLAAGYFKGGAKTGKGLHRNCMKPLLAGGSVPGVTVDAGEVQACLSKKARHHG